MSNTTRCKKQQLTVCVDFYCSNKNICSTLHQRGSRASTGGTKSHYHWVTNKQPVLALIAGFIKQHCGINTEALLSFSKHSTGLPQTIIVIVD